MINQLNVKKALIEKLYSKRTVDRITGCWFQKNGKRDQYHQGPQIKGVRPKLHVWSFAYFVRPIPAGHIIDHKCSNKGCWNPHHLQAVTYSVNTQLSWDRGERRDRTNQHTGQVYCKHGHEYTEENTIWYNDGRRDCRICENRRKREHYARKRGRECLS